MTIYRIAGVSQNYENGVSIRRYMLSAPVPNVTSVEALEKTTLLKNEIVAVSPCHDKNRDTNIKRNLVDSQFEPVKANGIEVVCYDVMVKGTNRPKTIDFAVVKGGGK